MKIVYLPSARDDLVWMRSYYKRVFPEGSGAPGRISDPLKVRSRPIPNSDARPTSYRARIASGANTVFHHL
jgi:hypothetical protein